MVFGGQQRGYQSLPTDHKGWTIENWLSINSQCGEGEGWGEIIIILGSLSRGRR